MSGLELCPDCKGLHYKNSPCIVRAPRRLDDLGSVKDARKMSRDGQRADALRKSDTRTPGEEKLGVTVGETSNRNKSRHRPGYFTEYMREYRKRPKLKASKSNPNTPERNDK